MISESFEPPGHLNAIRAFAFQKGRQGIGGKVVKGRVREERKDNKTIINGNKASK
jgi:hypothetical protein